MESLKLSEKIVKRLRCPITEGKLLLKNNFFVSKEKKTHSFPIIDGIPILINEKKSIFETSSFINKENTTWNLKPNKTLVFLKKALPSIGINFKARRNYKKLISLIPHKATILVIGGSIRGEGMDFLYENNSLEIIGLDVSYGPETKIIADSHDLPFENETFDCVIVQAVLEHVLDPSRCVKEIHRVLNKKGIVYAETPFMQQVHMKQYDFTRYTYLGHRRLFRFFEEIEHETLMGPGTVLAWSYCHFVKSFAKSKKIAFLLSLFAHSTSFFWKYFDYFMIDKPGSYDAASAFYFLGRKSIKILSDKDLLKNFRGFD